MSNFLIIEEGITVGRFENKEHRDSAFKEYFTKTNRNGYVKEELEAKEVPDE